MVVPAIRIWSTSPVASAQNADEAPARADATAKLKTVDPKLYEEVGVFFG